MNYSLVIKLDLRLVCRLHMTCYVNKSGICKSYCHDFTVIPSERFSMYDT